MEHFLSRGRRIPILLWIVARSCAHATSDTALSEEDNDLIALVMVARSQACDTERSPSPSLLVDR